MSSKVLLRVVAGIAGLAAIVVGIQQIRSGVAEIFKGENAEFSRQIQQGNQAVDQANQTTLAADSKWQTIAHDIDSTGVAIFRTDRRGEVDEVVRLYVESADKLGQASRSFASAAAIAKSDVRREYLSLKSKAFEEFAAVNLAMSESAKLVLYRSIADAAMLADQLKPKTAEVEAHKEAGNQITAQAEALTAKHPELFGQ